MTIRPCKEFIDCECSDNPFINTSAERPDPNLFFARAYYANNPALNVDDSWYERLSCLGTCFSEESQTDADDCAERNAQLCTWTVVQPPLTILSDDASTVPRTNIFGNAAVSCSSPCPEGPAFVFTVPANTFYALTQQEADALAQSVCDYRALVFRMCQNIPPEPPVCDVTITSVMPPSLYQYVNQGDSAAMGVTFNYSGTVPPSFLWYKDGVPYVTTMNPSLTLADAQSFDSGTYQLHILVPHCTPVLSPEFELIVCAPSVGVPAPSVVFDGPNIYYSYTTPVSLGTFAVVETGNTHDPGFGDNATDLGSKPAGWYEAVYKGGGREQTTPASPPNFFSADAWRVSMEIGSVPDSDVIFVPFDFSNYATCADAENSIGGIDGLRTGIIETTNNAGGSMKTIGPAWPVNGGFSLASCDGSRPEVEIVHYALPTQPSGLRVVDFTDFKNRLTVCPTCQNRLVGNEWDGTFYRQQYNPFDLVYLATVGASALAKFKNKRTNENSIKIILSTLLDSTPIWQLLIFCSVIGDPASGQGSQLIWVGYKDTGNTAEGVYLLDSDGSKTGLTTCVAQTVKCITIEST